MSQFLSQVLSQQMRLEQRLTPQLIQSMNVLQKPVADLEAHVNEVLESNAALEIAEPEEVEAQRDGRTPDRAAVDGEGERFVRFDGLTRAYDLDADSRPPHLSHRVRDSGEPDAKLAAMANTAAREITLQEHLMQQLTLLELDAATRRAAQAVIDHLDPDGYLRTPLESIAESVDPALSTDVLGRGLAAVQELEPLGVAARDVKECLLLQLQHLPGDNAVERNLIEHHLEDLARNRIPAIAKATGYSVEEINDALEVIRTRLNPHPGRQVGGEAPAPIRPDVIVEYAETGGGLTIRLARGNMPKLRIRDDVAAMARSREHDRELRDFAKRQVEEAAALIDAVQFRHSRLLEVATAIVEKQREFFDAGPEGLGVLRMSDLAEELQCDASTVSRTVAGKYVQTPFGMYPLRYFFTGGTQTEDGETVGWDRVKVKVKELIDREDPKNPINDEEISKRLGEQGIDISRRTVAKYRQQLDIPSSHQRRRY